MVNFSLSPPSWLECYLLPTGSIAEVGVFYLKTSVIKHSEISCPSPCNLIQGNSEAQSLSGTRDGDITENSASEKLHSFMPLERDGFSKGETV